jgi:hypothetical protein
MMDNRQLTRVRNFYITTAIIWLSSSIGIVSFIGASYVYTWIRYPKPAAVSHPYSPHARAAALHTLSNAAAASLFREFDKLETSRMYVYQPWVGFSERVFHSPLLNVDPGEPLPTRRTVEPAGVAASNKTIWLFGGSTQFGWGVPDNQTIASHLSAILSTGPTHYTVVNHGHTEFYFSQEAILFATLLRHGRKCDIAVFLDGLNDSQRSLGDAPVLADRTADGFLEEEDAAAAESSRYVFITPLFPPVRVLNGLLRRLVPVSSLQANPEAERLSRTKYDPVAIYRFNMSIIQDIAETQNIHVSFYWQPTSFDYIAGADKRRKDLPAFGNIPSLNVAVCQTIKNSRFHFIADMFKEDGYETTYVDWGHYGDEGNLRVAQVIADGLKNDGLLRQGDSN